MIFLRNNFRLVYNWSEFYRWSIICNIDSIILKKQALFTGFLLNIIWIVNGLFGDEEIREIIPAVSEFKTMGLNVEGPIAPDTVFLRCYKGEYDLVVAMYHDQGHIPLKLADFDGGVNITCGLPIIRTSVDHGTDFDIAGTNKAREDSLLQALAIAKKIV